MYCAGTSKNDTLCIKIQAIVLQNYVHFCFHSKKIVRENIRNILLVYLVF